MRLIVECPEPSGCADQQRPCCGGLRLAVCSVLIRAYCCPDCADHFKASSVLTREKDIHVSMLLVLFLSASVHAGQPVHCRFAALASKSAPGVQSELHPHGHHVQA